MGRAGAAGAASLRRGRRRLWSGPVGRRSAAAEPACGRVRRRLWGQG